MRNPVPENLHVSDDTLLFFQEPTNLSQPIEFFNDRLSADGHGRPFGVPVHIVDEIFSVPVSGPENAEQVLLDLESLGLAGQFALEPAYVDGTSMGPTPSKPVPHFASLVAPGEPLLDDVTVVVGSKPVPHGGTAFAEVAPPADRQPPAFPRPPAGLRRPVVALLDTGVLPHAWLPADDDPDDPFLIRADRQTPPWEPGRMTGSLEAHPVPEPGRESGETPEVPVYGHGTFIAGLIRQGAPTAQVLDIRVMSRNGKANEGKVCNALVWLLDYIASGHPVDVVCMAFGRVPGDDSDQPLRDKLEGLLGELAAKGVQLVASAGNDHQDSKIYPAAFEAVTAVGAGFGNYHATFSNFGEWVDRYRDGVNVLSIMPDEFPPAGDATPGKRWGRWSGTSFAAANFAADIARPHVR